MLPTVLRFETQRLLAGGAAGLTALLLLGLIAYAGYVGIQHTSEQRDLVGAYATDHAESLERVRARLVAAESTAVANGESLGGPVAFGMRHPYVIGSAQGRVLTLEPGPLAAFAVGQSDLQPAALRVTIGGREAMGGAAALDHPLKLLAGHLDLAFVFVFFFPLLVLALAFGLTSTERESGLLRMVLSHPVRLTTLAAGKLTVRAALLFGCAALGTGAVWLASGTEGGAGRWALWLLVVVLYGGFWLALAAFVDSRVRRPVTGGLALAACWLALVVVVPAVLNVVATTLYPVPSRMDYVAARRTAAGLAEREGAASLARYFNDHPELAAVEEDEADYAMLRVAQDERIVEALAPVEARFAEQKAGQQRFVRALGTLSPAVLAQQAFLDVAGTGHARYAAFEAQTEAFHRAWADRFAPQYFERRPLRPADLDALPTLDAPEESTADLLGRLAGPLAVLALASLLLAFAAGRSYAHPDSAL
ncbi:MAG: DUF3526 domain-containing protein [Bacteroidota bacterium]